MINPLRGNLVVDQDKILWHLVFAYWAGNWSSVPIELRIRAQFGAWTVSQSGTGWTLQWPHDINGVGPTDRWIAYEIWCFSLQVPVFGTIHAQKQIVIPLGTHSQWLYWRSGWLAQGCCGLWRTVPVGPCWVPRCDIKDFEKDLICLTSILLAYPAITNDLI